MCCACRAERTQQQYRDDVVNRVRAELTQEHTAHMEQLASQHQQHIQQLQYGTFTFNLEWVYYVIPFINTGSIHRSKLADLSQEVLAVQECYISVCKEKDKLEENLQNKLEEEKRLKEIEVSTRCWIFIYVFIYLVINYISF